MKRIEDTGVVPAIYTAHHASHDFGEFAPRVALTEEQMIRFSDYGTDQTVPLNGIVTIIAERSRALGDLNRDPEDPQRFQDKDYGRPERHDIWVEGNGLTENDKQFCQDNLYTPFHDAIVDELKARSDLTFVVSWDNTAHYEIGDDDAGNPVMMKPFILSNRGKQDSTGPGDEAVSCDPEFMKLLVKHFADELASSGLPNEIHLNLVMKGGYICRRYSTLRNKLELESLGITCEVQSLQVEYDTNITHDQSTLEVDTEKMKLLRVAFSSAIERAYTEYLAI